MELPNDILDLLLGPEHCKTYRFPGGFRSRYYTAKRKGYQRRDYFWSTTRNVNKKYVSGVYRWKGNHAKPTQVREHKTRRAAKARADRMHSRRYNAIHQAGG